MTKRHKTDLTAQMIWLGEQEQSNSLATTLKFLKFWGIRLPYQFVNLEACDMGLSFDGRLIDYILNTTNIERESELEAKLAGAQHFHLRNLLFGDNPFAQALKEDVCEADEHYVYLAKIVQTLLSADFRFLIVELGQESLPNEISAQVLAALTEQVKLSNSTAFIATSEATTWAACADYVITRLPCSRFSLSPHISHSQLLILPTKRVAASATDDAEVGQAIHQAQFQELPLKKLG